MSEIYNPQRNAKEIFGRNRWYPYYAGYSPRFAERVIRDTSLSRNSLVADPWNGSGTTTWAANSLGINSWGGDLNPVMKVVAKAKLLNADNCAAIVTLIEKIAKSSRGKKKGLITSDPLLNWLLPEVVQNFRSLESQIQKHVVPVAIREHCPLSIASASEISSFLYLCLFLLARRHVADRATSNPTWIKHHRGDIRDAGASSLGDSFLDIARDLLLHIEEDPRVSESSVASAEITVSSSTHLPLRSSSVDLVLTSPPYCTRLDYAVATSVELAVLGETSAQVYELRKTLMGTTTVPKAAGMIDPAWGRTCLSFLDKVRNHQSQASSGYYYKSHLQYFSDLHKSMVEISRVLRRNGSAVIVVQDSQYKELRNDLAAVVCEMADAVSLSLEKRSDFSKKLSLRSMHPGRANYGHKASPTESVLVFKPMKKSRTIS